MTGSADVRATLADLRQQLAAMADQIGPYAPPTQPSRFDRAERWPDRHGPVWDVASSSARLRARCLSVRALTNDEAPRCVYVEGADFSFGEHDWTALEPAEARAFAMALLAAADWAEDADPLHQRRAEAADTKRRLGAS